jgi:hypothetical protein
MRSVARLLVIMLFGSFITFMVIFSPILLEIITPLLKINTQKVSELGQSYGAISALLSAVALCVLAGSTVVQASQTRINQLHSARSFQLELLRMALDNPDYRETLGVDLSKLGTQQWRHHAYLNLWMMYLQMNFLTGATDEQGARRFLSAEFFNGPLGLEFWKRARAAFEGESSTRQQRRFFRVVDEEYNKGVSRSSVRPNAETA